MIMQLKSINISKAFALRCLNERNFPDFTWVFLATIVTFVIVACNLTQLIYLLELIKRKVPHSFMITSWCLLLLRLGY